jgi:hypothetical protein
VAGRVPGTPRAARRSEAGRTRPHGRRAVRAGKCTAWSSSTRQASRSGRQSSGGPPLDRAGGGMACPGRAQAAARDDGPSPGHRHVRSVVCVGFRERAAVAAPRHRRTAPQGPHPASTDREPWRPIPRTRRNDAVRRHPPALGRRPAGTDRRTPLAAAGRPTHSVAGAATRDASAATGRRWGRPGRGRRTGRVRS